MPAFLTHRAAGERILDKLEKGAVKHEKAFYLGCQGPDMLFFRNYHPWKAARESLMLGVVMHSEKIRALFKNALGFARQYTKQDKDELVSYIAGFIAHYSIDKNAHAFVYGKAGKDSGIHHATEFMWDSYSAIEQWNIEPQKFDIYSEVMYGQIGNGISEWYKTAAKEVYGKDIKIKMTRQAQRHFAKAKRALEKTSKSLSLRVLIKIVSTIMGFDVRSMMYPEQRDYLLFSQEEYKDMQRMISKGVDEAAEMITFALGFIGGSLKTELPNWFGDMDFAGKPIKA